MEFDSVDSEEGMQLLEERHHSPFMDSRKCYSMTGHLQTVGKTERKK